MADWGKVGAIAAVVGVVLIPLSFPRVQDALHLLPHQDPAPQPSTPFASSVATTISNKGTTEMPMSAQPTVAVPTYSPASSSRDVVTVAAIADRSPPPKSAAAGESSAARQSKGRRDLVFFRQKEFNDSEVFRIVDGPTRAFSETSVCLIEPDGHVNQCLRAFGNEGEATCNREVAANDPPGKCVPKPSEVYCFVWSRSSSDNAECYETSKQCEAGLAQLLSREQYIESHDYAESRCRLVALPPGQW